MENGLVSRLGLTIGLKVDDGGEPSLIPQGTKIISELSSVELSTIIKDYGMGNAEMSDEVPPDEPSHLTEVMDATGSAFTRLVN